MLVADKRALAFFFKESVLLLLSSELKRYIADEVEPAAGDTDARVNHAGITTDAGLVASGSL
jgi:hypothetical protein